MQWLSLDVTISMNVFQLLVRRHHSSESEVYEVLVPGHIYQVTTSMWFRVISCPDSFLCFIVSFRNQRTCVGTYRIRKWITPTLKHTYSLHLLMINTRSGYRFADYRSHTHPWYSLLLTGSLFFFFVPFTHTTPCLWDGRSWFLVSHCTEPQIYIFSGSLLPNMYIFLITVHCHSPVQCLRYLSRFIFTESQHRCDSESYLVQIHFFISFPESTDTGGTFRIRTWIWTPVLDSKLNVQS